VEQAREKLRELLAAKAKAENQGTAEQPGMRDEELELTTASVQGWSRSAAAEMAFDTRKGQTTPRVIPANAWDSGRLTNRTEGALRTASFTIRQPFLHVLAAGRGGRVKVVVDGFEVIREPIYGGLRRIVDNTKPHWLTFDLTMWEGRQVYLECLDGGPGDLAVTDHPKGNEHWLQVRRAVFSTEAKAPPLPAEAPAPALPEGEAWAKAVAAFREAEQALPAPRYALATAEGTGEDEVVFTRGNHRLPGAPVPRGLSAVFCGTEPLEVGAGSGRLALAQRLVDPARNPLLVRVVVNRVWKHHFGEGLVRSVDDFGRMGQQPSHPELLEHLCQVFITNGWSLKKLHREIVLSRAYRQAPRNNDPQAAQVDPQGRWLSHARVRRLEAEAIRDAMLAVSGQLKHEPMEEGVMPHLTPLMQGRGRPGTSGPLDGSGRRSIFLNVRRNFLPPLMTAFDFPTPFSTMGRRSVSNVPAQGLALMNDPFVLEQARHWAARVVKETADERERLEHMYLQAFTRLPTDNERHTAMAFVKQHGNEAWTHLAHALVCSKEFVFVR
jgi:hypothetical protein